MYSQINEPQQRLSKETVKVWLISELLLDGIGFLVLGVLFYLDSRFDWKEWIGWILIAILGLSFLSFIWGIIKPFFLYKNWRYDINEEFLQLKSGAIIEEHQLIPMTKIQSVATEQGPIQRRYKLRSILITTMGSIHKIPPLPEEIATELRNQIAHHAKLKEVE